MEPKWVNQKHALTPKCNDNMQMGEVWIMLSKGLTHMKLAFDQNLLEIIIF